MDQALLVKNAVSTVRLIKTFGVPVVRSTVNVASSREQPTLPELADLLTNDKPLDQTTINSWENIEFVQAIHATGRRKLIFCALWTEMCMALCRPRRAGLDLKSHAASTGAWNRRRWLILGVIGLSQVMVIMSLTVMNVALLSAQRALHFSTADQQWVVTAYTLAFGSLLLLGGRLADLLGRKATFLAGLAGFACVSAIGGARTFGDASRSQPAGRP
jgi:hypothetical protein